MATYLARSTRLASLVLLLKLSSNSDVRLFPSYILEFQMRPFALASSFWKFRDSYMHRGEGAVHKTSDGVTISLSEKASEKISFSTSLLRWLKVRVNFVMHVSHESGNLKDRLLAPMNSLRNQLDSIRMILHLELYLIQFRQDINLILFEYGKKDSSSPSRECLRSATSIHDWTQAHRKEKNRLTFLRS